MHPWDAVTTTWATPHTPPCDGQPVYTHDAARRCQRELEILGHPRQHPVPCPHCDHHHLWRDHQARVTVNEIWARQLLRILQHFGTARVPRLTVRDLIGWRKTGATQRRKHFNRMLGVLSNYDLITLDDTHLTVVNPETITNLVRLNSTPNDHTDNHKPQEVTDERDTPR